MDCPDGTAFHKRGKAIEKVSLPMVSVRATPAIFAVVGLLFVVTVAVSACGEVELDGKLTGELFWGPDSWGNYENLPTKGYIRLVDVTGLQEISEWVFGVESDRVVASGTLGTGNGKGRVLFTIPYNVARIDPDSDYAIIARYSWSKSSAPLVGEGRIFTNFDYSDLSPPLVLTKGRPHNDVEVELMVLRWIT